MSQLTKNNSVISRMDDQLSFLMLECLEFEGLSEDQIQEINLIQESINAIISKLNEFERTLKEKYEPH